MAQALTIDQLPSGTDDLYVVGQTDACELGIGTPDELRELIAEGVLPEAQTLRFRLEWAA